MKLLEYVSCEKITFPPLEPLQGKISVFYWEYQCFYIQFRSCQLDAAIFMRYGVLQTPHHFCFGDVCLLTACGLFSRPTGIIWKRTCHRLDPARGHPLDGQKAVLRQLLAELWYKQRSGAFADPSTMMLSNRHWLNVYLLVSLQQHNEVEGLLGLNLTHSYATTKAFSVCTEGDSSLTLLHS